MAAFSSTAFSTSAFSVNAFSFDGEVTPDQPSGGFVHLGGRRRTPEEIREDRVRFGVLPARIIEDVAARQAENYLRLDEQQRLEELQGEFRLAGLRAESRHFEALAEQREALLDAEIAKRMRLIVEEQELAMFVLLVAAV